MTELGLVLSEELIVWLETKRLTTPQVLHERLSDVEAAMVRLELRFEELEIRMTAAESHWQEVANMIGLVAAEMASIRQQMAEGTAAAVDAAQAEHLATDIARADGLVASLRELITTSPDIPAEVPDVPVPDPGEPAVNPDDPHPDHTLPGDLPRSDGPVGPGQLLGGDRPSLRGGRSVRPRAVQLGGAMLHAQLNREPALLWVGLIAPLVAALSAFLWVDNPAVQSWINAAAVAIAAAITAIMVKAEDAVPLILGAIQALIALGVGLGLGWSPEQQALLMVPVGIIVSIIMRDRVVAPVPPVVPVQAG